MSLDPGADLWPLPIAGFEVLEIWFSGRLYVIAYGDGAGGRTQIALGGAFLFRSPDGTEHQLNGQDAWHTLVPLLALRHARIVDATADRNSILDVRFDDRSALSSGPDPKYENWEIAGPAGLNLVAPPGGGDPRISD